MVGATARSMISNVLAPQRGPRRASQSRIKNKAPLNLPRCFYAVSIAFPCARALGRGLLYRAAGTVGRATVLPSFLARRKPSLLAGRATLFSRCFHRASTFQSLGAGSLVPSCCHGGAGNASTQLHCWQEGLTSLPCWQDDATTCPCWQEAFLAGREAHHRCLGGRKTSLLAGRCNNVLYL